MTGGPTGAPAELFADLLRRHRTAAGLTQEALAERAGLSARGVSDLERGARRAPQRSTVQRLIRALGAHPPPAPRSQRPRHAVRPRPRRRTGGATTCRCS